MLVLAATWVWLSANWVTYTQEELVLLEQKSYEWPIFIGDERIELLVKDAYTHCVDRIGTGTNIVRGRSYSCMNQVLTWTAENGAWGWRVKSPTNDHWICQLNYRWHKSFIDSEEFKDPMNQIKYCEEVWENAMLKWSMPRAAYAKRNSKKYLFK